MNMKGMPLFYKFLAILLGAVIFISSALIAVFYFFSKEAFGKNLQVRVVSYVEEIDHDFNYEVKERLLDDLGVLASNPAIDESMALLGSTGELNLNHIIRLYEQYISHRDDIKSIYLVDDLGKEKIRVDKWHVKKYPEPRLDRLFLGLKFAASGSVNIEGPYEDRNKYSLTYGKFLFAVGIPKFDPVNGVFRGAVVIEYSIGGFIGHLTPMLVYGPVWVFAPDGNIIKQPQQKEAIFDPSKYFSQKPQATIKLMEFKEGIVAYKDLYITGDEQFMRVAVSIPKTLLHKELVPVIRFFSFVFFVSIAAMFLVAYYLAKRLSRPIIELSHAASRLSKGDFSAAVKIKSTGVEIRALVDNFNKMAKDLNMFLEKEKDFIKSQSELAMEKKNAEELEVLNNQLNDAKDELEKKINGLEALNQELERVKNSLEEKVKERTTELENERASLEVKVGERTKELYSANGALKKKIAELEGLTAVTVDREIRMIELKKEVNGLCKELGREKPYG